MTKRNSIAVTAAVYTRKPPGPKSEKPATSFSDPSQPYSLTVHPAGYFSKKARGKVHYFARWDEGAELAEVRWNKVKDDLLAGRQPRDEEESGGLTVRRLLSEYRNHKRRMNEQGRITGRTLVDCIRVCDFLAKRLDKGRLVVDLGPRDFSNLLDAMMKQRRKGKSKSLVVLGNEITRIKSVFHLAVKEGMLTRMPTFGSEFMKPAAKAVEKQKAAKVEDEDSARSRGKKSCACSAPRRNPSAA